ncbi:serine aminopeptidase domain-containing protein [Nocardioides acrostichi]|uniref:Alpha/beta hydrolase n=1 Tax=Nocardioides acrostichi TaxID=2784339 RepID=A0A930YB16_9ACTN|nr:alpha/beta hydrolase [Nocardioides acrostichi]MBF4161978.1 alpha/beta hydrolase [Nocardioides acrostichi]
MVLISPAMAIGSGYYRPLVEELRSRGWEARALGRRGFERGQPRASRGNDWTYADEIADTADAVAAARAERAERPVLLLGHSLGGQVAAGHQLLHPPADGLVAVGSHIPHYRHHDYGGVHLLAMAGVIVPVTTTIFGHLPRPAFGAPGARGLMREWARMVLTGRPPYPVERPIARPALVVSLEGDTLAPRRGVDHFAELFEPGVVRRWHPDEPADHIGWVREPAFLVETMQRWWHDALQRT